MALDADIRAGGANPDVFSISWGRGAGDIKVSVDVSASTIWVTDGVTQSAAFKFKRQQLERAKILFEKLARDGSQGFLVNEADLRELSGLLDPQPG
jgi:hypothetical protein